MGKGESQANNSLQPTRTRRAKVDSGLADVPATHSRGSLADEGTVWLTRVQALRRENRGGALAPGG